MKCKLFKLFSRIATWQPKPYIAIGKDNQYYSKWFYKKIGVVTLQRNDFGAWWLNFWMDIADKFY